MNTTTAEKVVRRTRRHARLRKKVIGTALRPRLSVYRSNRALYAQIINDETQTTIVAADTRNLEVVGAGARAHALGKKIAELGMAKGVTMITFDRGGFQYKGSVVQLAEGAREGGLVF